MLQDAVGFHAEIVVGGVVEDDAVLLHRGGGAGSRLYGQCVAEVEDGHKEGFEVVVAVRAFAHNVQPQVNLAVGVARYAECRCFVHRHV